MRRSILAAILLSALIVPACTGPDADVSGVSRRDSAGIAIVENTAPLWPGDSAWLVGAEPLVSIGAADGPDEYTFGSVWDLAVLEDGTIVVGDQLSRELSFFDRSGRFVWKVGGEGEGPGEFRSLLGVKRYRGDSILAFDYARARITVFGADGGYGRVIMNPFSRTDNYWLAGALPRGALVLTSPGRSMMPGPPGVRMDSTRVIVLESDGSVGDTVGAFGIGLKRVDERGFSHPLRFGLVGLFAMSDDQLVWGDAVAYEFRVHDPTGRPIRLVRRAHDQQPVTDETIDRLKRWYRDNVAMPGGEARLEQVLDAMEFAEVIPAYSQLHVDATGHVWVGRYHYSLSRPTEWDVFAPDGRWLATVHMPEQFQVKHIGTDRLVGVRAGAMGVEYVEVYGLRKAGW